MKNINDLFDNLIEKLGSEQNNADKMKTPMAVREYLLLNLTTKQLLELSKAVKFITIELERILTGETINETEILIELIPELATGEDITEMSEEAGMVLTNLTLDYLLDSEKSEYAPLTVEEYINFCSKYRPLVNNMLGTYAEEYLPVTYQKYSQYLEAVEIAKENSVAIKEGVLESLLPLYDSGLIGIEKAIDNLYTFTVRLRYDLTLIWGVRSNLLKIDPVFENNVQVDWGMEVAPKFHKFVEEMLVSNSKGESE